MSETAVEYSEVLGDSRLAFTPPNPLSLGAPAVLRERVDRESGRVRAELA